MIKIKFSLNMECHMKKLAVMFAGLLIMNAAAADADLANLLNRVSLQLKADKWVTSQSAKVLVTVDAGVADQGIEKLQSQVLGKLGQISSAGEWHITSFNRQLDKSGLESVHINAEARLPQTELANLRSKAKSLSKPGETYTIADVQFTPSDEELMQANSTLRSMIYQQARTEIDTLNKAYPDQKFYLYQIDFNSYSVMPAMEMKVMNMAASAAVAMPAPLNVGNKQTMVANVVLASMPDALSKKAALVNP
jgi:hypothetical protein